MSETDRPGPPLLVLVGPTGTGKSAVALRVAREIGGEIVGCDALQLYRGFDAATAKPDLRSRSDVAHHLIDCFDPRQDCSMAEYVRAADRAIAEIRGRGHVALVVGGTGLYLRGLLRGVLPAPSRDPALRERLRGIVDRGGRERLRRWLRRHDPAAEGRIGAGDTQRLLRAVELARSEGGNWSERLERQGNWEHGEQRYRALKIGLDEERTRLHQRLDARVDAFFAAGLVQEVRDLIRQGIPRGANAFKAIGYREVLEALEAGQDPEALRAAVQSKTRRYAKRQRTWFRTEPELIWLDVSPGIEATAERVIELWRRSDVTARQ